MRAAARFVITTNRKLLALILVFATAVAIAAPSAAQQPVQARATVDLNARSGPDIQYPVLFQIPQNSIVSVQGCNQDYSWCQVVYAGMTGWSSGSLLQAVQNNQPISSVGGQLGLALLDFILGQLGIPQQPQQPQQPPAPPPPPTPGTDEICFYRDANFAGEAFCVNMGQSNAALTVQWNDVISSIRVGTGATVQVCGDVNYGGWCQTYSDDVNLASTRNDSISSYRTVGIAQPPPPQQPQPPPSPPQQPGASQVCFYRDANLSGLSFCVGMGAVNPNIGSSWNDAISSVGIGAGSGVQICGDPNYAGWCQIYTQSSNLIGVADNSASSYRTVGYPGGPGPAPGGQVQARAVVDLNARSGPGAEYPVQYVIGAGAVVTVPACTLSYGWCQVMGSGGTAWASAAYLQDTQYNQLLVNVGAQLGIPLVDPPAPPAQPAPPTPSASQVCFYRDANFTGTAFCADVGQGNLSLTSPWNDTISSIRVGADVTAQVCGDPNLSGWCQTYADNVTLTSTRNDSISSFRVVAVAAPPPQANPLVCVYSGANYTGAGFCFGVGTSYTQMPSGWDNTISSLRVDAGISVQVCEQQNFLGWCDQYTGNQPSLSGTRNDAISSMRTSP